MAIQDINNMYRYTNETFSGCDMVASITININVQNPETKEWTTKPVIETIGELQTVSYSIYMEKKPVRSIGNVNAKDYTMGPRTIAGTLVFSLFNKHFAKKILEKVNNGYRAGTAFLVDELPPFDITISAANEYGYRSRMAIYGIRLLNEGQVMSINDVYTENTYQYFATDVEYFDDEKGYVRNSSSKMYKLSDRLDVVDTIDPRFKLTNNLLSQEISDNYNSQINQAARLNVDVKQPVRANSQGIATFTLTPAQDSGKINITDINTSKKISATLNASVENRQRKLSVGLDPGKYSAIFTNNRTGKNSNIVKFLVNNVYVKDNLKLYEPIIEYVTDTSIEIYSNEPMHNKVKINLNANTDNDVFDIVNRHCLIENLSPNTAYSLFTYNDKDGIPSKQVYVKTLNEKDTLFNKLLLFISANSSQMQFPDLIDYRNLINEAKTVAFNNNEKITDSLLDLKRKYINLYNNSLKEDKDYYNIKIGQINELIYFSNRLFNDFISAVNDKIDVPIPKMKLNSQYENVFTFDKKITTAEIFKDYGNIVQFYYEVPNYNFKTIDGVDNSFRFNGKPGKQHYIQALIGKYRSPKLEFYVMTQKEKDEFIKRDRAKKKLSEKQIKDIDNKISQDNLSLLSSSDYERSFLINALKIEKPLVIPPEVINIDNDVTVITSINDLFCDDIDNRFYLAIATYEQILNKDAVYKIDFCQKDKQINISKIFNGLKKNTSYAIWIEDSNLNHISNATTFVFNPDFDIDNDKFKNYSIDEMIQNIESMAESLPREVRTDIKSILENDASIQKNEIINSILCTLLDASINKGSLIKFLKYFKYYIGLFGTSEENIFNEIEFKDDICSFLSDISGNLLITSITKDGTTSILRNLNIGDIDVSLNDLGDLILIIGYNDKQKSKLILINRVNKYMEVL